MARTRRAFDNGSINQSVISPRRLKPYIDSNGERVITARQLLILFYHFYLTINDVDIGGFMDCEKTAVQFQNEMDHQVAVPQEVLEKLLYTLQIAYENGLYWNPAKEEMDFFIKNLLLKNERFDKLSCLIMKKKGP